MDQVQARLISLGRDGSAAEVVALLGQKSVTRHVKGVVLNGWVPAKNGAPKSVPVFRGVGRNPDEAAIARLDAVEVEEARTLKAYKDIASLAEIALPELRKIISRMRKFREEAVDVPAGLWHLIDAILRKKAEFIFSAIQEDVADALADAAMAHSAANKVRAEVQRTVEFVF